MSVITPPVLVPDGKTDNYHALQAYCLTLTSRPKLYLSAGEYKFSQPVFMGPYPPEIVGVGRYQTTLSTFPGQSHPILVYGLNRTLPSRPDCLGVLDRTFVSAPGTRLGFATQGKNWGLLTAHPLTLGTMVNGNWDYHSLMTGWTLETAFSTPVAGGPLMGIGSSTSNPAPWFLSYVGNGEYYFGFKTSDYSPDWNVGQMGFFFTITVTTGLIKLRLWIDWTLGTVGVVVNGTSVPITWNGAALVAGKRFCQNPGTSDFFVGTDQDHAVFVDFTVYGFRTSNMARKVEPTNDGGRYLNDPNTIAFMPGTGTAAVDFSGGNAGGADLTVGSMMTIPKTPVAGIAGGGVSDLTVSGGSPSILIGAVLESFYIKRVEGLGGTRAFCSLPSLAPSYPICIEDCCVSGSDCGMSLWRTESYINRLVVKKGGITSLRFMGCNINLSNVFIAFFSQVAESAVDFLGEQYGALSSIDGINIDSETSGFSVAVIRAELCPYVGATTLEVRRLNVSGVGGVPLVKLIGHTGTAYNPGLLTGCAWAVYTNDYSMSVEPDVGWTVSVDTGLPK